MFLYYFVSEVMNVPTEKVLSEETTWSYLRDIILGLEYCKCCIYLAIRYGFPLPQLAKIQ